MKNFKVFFYLLIATGLLVVSCSKDSNKELEESVNESTQLATATDVQQAPDLAKIEAELLNFNKTAAFKESEKNETATSRNALPSRVQSTIETEYPNASMLFYEEYTSIPNRSFKHYSVFLDNGMEVVVFQWGHLLANATIEKEYEPTEMKAGELDWDILLRLHYNYTNEGDIIEEVEPGNNNSLYDIDFKNGQRIVVNTSGRVISTGIDTDGDDDENSVLPGGNSDNGGLDDNDNSNADDDDDGLGDNDDGVRGNQDDDDDGDGDNDDGINGNSDDDDDGNGDDDDGIANNSTGDDDDDGNNDNDDGINGNSDDDDDGNGDNDDGISSNSDDDDDGNGDNDDGINGNDNDDNGNDNDDNGNDNDDNGNDNDDNGNDNDDNGNDNDDNGNDNDDDGNDNDDNGNDNDDNGNDNDDNGNDNDDNGNDNDDNGNDNDDNGNDNDDNGNDNDDNGNDNDDDDDGFTGGNDSSRISVSSLPQSVKNQITINYVGIGIKSAKQSVDKFEVKLKNGITLKFDLKGNLINSKS